MIITYTYTAFDGKTFNDQKECEDYEDKLKPEEMQELYTRVQQSLAKKREEE